MLQNPLCWLFRETPLASATNDHRNDCHAFYPFWSGEEKRSLEEGTLVGVGSTDAPAPAGDQRQTRSKKNVQAYVPLPHATGCGICTRLCIIHFFLCGLSALDRAALIGEEICERITNQQTPNFGAGYARTTDGAAVPSG